MGLPKRIDKEDKTKCQILCGKTSFILCRLQGFIGLPVMISLTDNAIHHPLWRKWRKGWGYGERVKVIKMERIKILMRRGDRVKRQELAQWKHARALHHCL